MRILERMIALKIVQQEVGSNKKVWIQKDVINKSIMVLFAVIFGLLALMIDI